MSSFRLLTPGDPGAAYFTFQRRNIPPPSALYIMAGEGLQISAWSSINPTSFEVRGRILVAGILVKEIRSQFIFPTGNTRQQVQTFQPLPEGFLLDLAVFPSPGVITTRGQVFVSIGLARGPSSSPYLTRALCQGYLENTIALQWPGAIIQGFLDGAGFLRYVVGTTPGLGQNSTETVPTGARWRLQSYHFRYVASGVAGVRVVSIFFESATVPNIWAETYAGRGQNPGENVVYEVAPFSGGLAPASVQLINITTPMFLKAADFIVVSATNFDAGDQITQPTYYVEEWLQP